MNTKINLDKKSLVTLVALAEGIKTSRPMTGPADLLDLATRLAELAKACDDRNTVTACVNGMYFTYDNASALVNKAAGKVEAEANRLVSATLHLVEDLFSGHAAGTVTVGGIPTNDTDGDNQGGDQEVFDRLARPFAIKKYPELDGHVFVRQSTGMTAGLHVKKHYGK